jgi:ferredoxin
MPAILEEDDSDDSSFNLADEAEEVDGDLAEEEIGEQEANELQEDLIRPLVSAPGGTAILDHSFSRMSISAPIKMVAVVDSDWNSTPYPTVHSVWKDSDRQQRLSLALNMPSGTSAADVTPLITSSGWKISISKKWSKQLFVLSKVLTTSFLKDLHKAGHCPNPGDFMEHKDYPFHQVSIATGLASCIKKLKVAPDVTGDWRPSITHTLAVPFQLDRVFCDLSGALSNAFELYGLEGEKISEKATRGLWHQALFLEAVNHRSTFEEPEGPAGFKPVQRSIGSWATKLEDVQMPSSFSAASSTPSSANKRARGNMTTDEVQAQLKKQEDDRRMGIRMKAMMDTIEESEKKKDEIELDFVEQAEELDRAVSNIEDLKLKLHQIEHQYQTKAAEVSKLRKTVDEAHRIDEGTCRKLAEMETCANIAVGNAKVAVGYVNDCVRHCGECITACTENDGQKATAAASAAQAAGAQACEASKRAANVNNPSPLAQEAYDDAFDQAKRLAIPNN